MCHPKGAAEFDRARADRHRNRRRDLQGRYGLGGIRDQIDGTAKQEAAIRSLTKAQVDAAIKKYIDPKRLVIVTSGTLKGKPATNAKDGEKAPAAGR